MMTPMISRSELLSKENVSLNDDEYIEIPSELDSVFEGLLDRIHKFEHSHRTRSKFIARESWVEHDDVAFSYSYQHCPNCEEELYTFRFPVAILNAENLEEQLDVWFIELQANRDLDKADLLHFQEAEKIRADIRALRYLAQKYPQYLDLSVELPDLPANPTGSDIGYEEPEARVMVVRKLSLGGYDG